MTTKNYFTDLQTYSFSQSDIDLLKRALKVAKIHSAFSNMQSDYQNLIEYIERLEKEKADENA